MKKFQEGKVVFIFDETWECEKWDDSRSYAEGIGKLQGATAVDFLGIQDHNLYLIEVKDFRGHRIENKARQEQALPTEIACKVRDTIAGVIGTSLTRKDDELACHCAHILGERGDADKIRVIAWIIEDDLLPAKDKIRASVRGKLIKTRLRWLTSKVKESNPLVHPLLTGVTVRNLKH